LHVAIFDFGYGSLKTPLKPRGFKRGFGVERDVGLKLALPNSWFIDD
jgi:hypothetical protein